MDESAKKRLPIDCGSSKERVKRLLTADLRITLALNVCKKKQLTCKYGQKTPLFFYSFFRRGRENKLKNMGIKACTLLETILVNC